MRSTVSRTIIVIGLLVSVVFLGSLQPIDAAGNFGFDQIGSSYYDVPADDIIVGKWTLGDADQFTNTIRFYGRSPDTVEHNGKAIICDSSEMLVAVGEPCTITNSNGWQTLTFSTYIQLNASTTYFLGLISDYQVRVYYNSTLFKDNILDTSNSYASPTDPEDGADDSTREFSIYAETHDQAPHWNLINEADFVFHVEWNPAAQFGFDMFFILLGLIMVPTSTVYLVRGGRSEASMDKLFWGLVIFFVGWGLIIGGIMP